MEDLLRATTLHQRKPRTATVDLRHLHTAAQQQAADMEVTEVELLKGATGTVHRAAHMLLPHQTHMVDPQLRRQQAVTEDTVEVSSLSSPHRAFLRVELTRSIRTPTQEPVRRSTTQSLWRSTTAQPLRRGTASQPLWTR